VIVGRVAMLRPAVHDGPGAVPGGVEIEVVRAIKGNLGGSVFIATASMCNQDIGAEDLVPGQTYVLPLQPPYDWGHGPDSISPLPTPATEPRGRWFELPACSETALLLKDGNLYSNEPSPFGGLDYYMSLGMLERLLPLGVLYPVSRWVLAVMAIVIPLAILWLRRRRERKSRQAARV
jgi:hypothetical protein